jgi:AcrR family transcriptional regulator
MDKRIQKTRHALQQALLTLIQQKPFEQIQIQDITNAADTARVTFYRHYSTKEELLLDSLDQFYEDMKAFLDEIESDDVLDLRQTPPDLALFSFCDEHSELSRILLTGPTSWLVQDRVRHYIVERITQAFLRTPKLADLPIALIAHMIASSTIGNLIWWLTRGKPYSVEYIAHLTHTMSLTGAFAAVGRLELVTLPDVRSWRQ